MQIPKFIMFKNFGMLDTLYPLFITNFLEIAFYIFLFRRFYSRLPASLEAARGWIRYGYFRNLDEIFIPLSLPICTSVGIIGFMGSGATFNDPSFYINSD